MPTPRIRLGDLSVSFAEPLAQALTQAGHDPLPLLQQFGLTPQRLAQPRSRLSIPRYMRLGHAAIRLSGDPALGLRMGACTRLGQMGLAGICAAQAPNVREAARMLTRYEPLYANNYRGRSSLYEDARGAWLQFYSISPYNAYNQFVVESVLSGWLSSLTQVAARPLRAERIQIEFAEPAHAATYTAILGCPIEFEASHNRLRLSLDTLAIANPQHCPGTWHQLLEVCDRKLEQLTHTRSVSEQVIQLLGPMLHGHEPDLTEIASRLQMPAWTLRRRLAAEGNQFRQLLNDTRRDLATAYIRDTELAFGEIAYLLGFASAEAFQRAFKRWQGQTPGDFRRQQRLAPGNA